MHFLGCRVSLFVYGTYASERRPSVFGMNGLCGEPSSLAPRHSCFAPTT